MVLQSFYSKIKEYIQLIWINLKVKASNCKEFISVIFKYYPNFTFFKIDTALLLSYLFSSPFRISKEFLLRKGEKDVYKYGETPLTTMDAIAHRCGLTSRDVVFELGCGRGRTCFWLNQFIGCNVVGIEFVPLFVEKALKIKKAFDIKNVTFRLEDLFQADLKGATVIYLYGTCFSSDEIDLLVEQFMQLPNGTKIISVSYALTDYRPEAPFQVKMQFPASFTWGNTQVFLQVKT